MSESSPSDLAITFRSLPRRLSEARGELADAEVHDHLSSVGTRLERAAALVHSTADPAHIADAIEAVPADAWGDELAELRTIALDLGAAIRQIAAANPDIDD
jgi:hypothetical protein